MTDIDEVSQPMRVIKYTSCSCKGARIANLERNIFWRFNKVATSQTCVCK